MKEKERMKYPIFGIRIYPCQSINVTAIGIMFLVFIWKAPCGHVPGSLVVECPPQTQVQLKVVNLTLHISTLWITSTRQVNNLCSCPITLEADI